MTKRRKLWVWRLIGVVLVLTTFCSGLLAASSKEPRTDGLTSIECNVQDDNNMCYVTLLLKSGSASDPKDKEGLTALTNSLIFWQMWFLTPAINASYGINADFSRFSFIVPKDEYQEFMGQLDLIIRQDALMQYDMCNAMIRYLQNQPKWPEEAAVKELYLQLYGEEHPYLNDYRIRWEKLNINDVNVRFRGIYRPNNIIIASSQPISEDFLRKPFGREIVKVVPGKSYPPRQEEVGPARDFVAVRDNISTILLGFTAPTMREKDFYTAILTQRYLQERLTKVIREKSGLCYALAVYYDYHRQAAPPFIIFLQTLPEETGLVVEQIKTELSLIAANGIPEEELARIIRREKNQMETWTRAMDLVAKRAIQSFFNYGRIYDDQGYLTGLESVKNKQVMQWMKEKLPELRVVVAGPEEQ